MRSSFLAKKAVAGLTEEANKGEAAPVHEAVEPGGEHAPLVAEALVEARETVSCHSLSLKLVPMVQIKLIYFAPFL